MKNTNLFGIPIESTIFICPECKGEPSAVKIKHVGHPNHFESFWDCEGRRHDHYLGPGVAILRCSNGHETKVVESLDCWCGSKSFSRTAAEQFLRVYCKIKRYEDYKSERKIYLEKVMSPLALKVVACIDLLLENK